MLYLLEDIELKLHVQNNAEPLDLELLLIIKQSELIS